MTRVLIFVACLTLPLASSAAQTTVNVNNAPAPAVSYGPAAPGVSSVECPTPPAVQYVAPQPMAPPAEYVAPQPMTRTYTTYVPRVRTYTTYEPRTYSVQAAPPPAFPLFAYRSGGYEPTYRDRPRVSLAGLCRGCKVLRHLRKAAKFEAKAEYHRALAGEYE